MKSSLFALVASFLMSQVLWAKKIDFEEYDLKNGLHVVIHQDNAVQPLEFMERLSVPLPPLLQWVH